jgi:hypothetical protein
LVIVIIIIIIIIALTLTGLARITSKAFVGRTGRGFPAARREHHGERRESVKYTSTSTYTFREENTRGMIICSNSAAAAFVPGSGRY